MLSTRSSFQSPLPAPGNALNRVASYLVIWGQLSDARTGSRALVNFCTATKTLPTNPPRMSGEAWSADANARHIMLFPSRRVCALKTLPVRSSMSTPVNVFGWPVFPPRRINSGLANSMLTASAVKSRIVYSSPIKRRYH